jgi:hypothetical protein
MVHRGGHVGVPSKRGNADALSIRSCLPASSRARVWTREKKKTLYQFALVYYERLAGESVWK